MYCEKKTDLNANKRQQQRGSVQVIRRRIGYPSGLSILVRDVDLAFVGNSSGGFSSDARASPDG